MLRQSSNRILNDAKAQTRQQTWHDENPNAQATARGRRSRLGAKSRGRSNAPNRQQTWHAEVDDCSRMASRRRIRKGRRKKP